MKKKLTAGVAILGIVCSGALLAPKPVPQPPTAKAAMRAPTSCKQAKRALRRYLHRLHVGYCHWIHPYTSWHYFNRGKGGKGWTVISYYKDGPYGGVFFRFHVGFW